MNGRRLAVLARQLRPLKVLFVTAYAGLAAVRGKFLDTGMHMSKPFSVDALGAKIRSLLKAAA